MAFVERKALTTKDTKRDAISTEDPALLEVLVGLRVETE